MKDRILNKVAHRINGSFFTTVVKRGLGMMIPFIFVGAMACALRDLPITFYQEWLTSEKMTWLYSFLTAMNSGTFGLFSVAMVIALSFSFAMEKNETYDSVAMYVIVSLGAFGAQLNMTSPTFTLDALGSVGCFPAIFVTYLSCMAYTRLRRCKWLTLEGYTAGMGGICVTAIQAFLPMALIVGAVSLFNQFLYAVFDVYSIQEFVSTYLCKIFEWVGTDNNFLAGLLYTLLLHLFWFCGLHGSHMLEPVAQNNFAFVENGPVMSKPFFDTFIVMGGCGTTICVLIALLLFFRKDRMGKLGKLAAVTVVFNINETLNFGIPIILNPIMFIPFLATPLVSYVISYGTISMGLVPAVCRANSWTAPIIMGGYTATGSPAGALLQVVCIVVGTGIYLPFLRWNKRAEEEMAKEQVRELVRDLQEKEESNQVPQLLTRGDNGGLIARMLLQDLKYALKNRELFMLYQPQITAGGECFGAEALLRWNHPVYGFIYPPLIIYLAEEGGIQQQLERFIVDTVADSIAQIGKAYDGQFKISMNITAQSLTWEIEEYIEECQKKYSISPERLWIEITEQEMLSKADMVIDKLNHLKQAGHTLLIDDFGMGHTSLLYLQSNYFDVVKLDGSLVRNLLSNETNQKIIASVVELGQELGVDVIAEYVETKEQQEMLYRLGCKQYQGYMYSKPITLTEFIAYIKEYNKQT